MDLKFYRSETAPSNANNGAVGFDETNKKIFKKENGSFVEYSQAEKPVFIIGNITEPQFNSLEGSFSSIDGNSLYLALYDAITTKQPVYLYINSAEGYDSSYIESDGTIIPAEVSHEINDESTNYINITCNFKFYDHIYNLSIKIDSGDVITYKCLGDYRIFSENGKTIYTTPYDSISREEISTSGSSEKQLVTMDELEEYLNGFEYDKI